MLDNLQLLINAGNVTKTDPKISTLELGLLVYWLNNFYSITRQKLTLINQLILEKKNYFYFITHRVTKAKTVLPGHSWSHSLYQ